MVCFSTSTTTSSGKGRHPLAHRAPIMTLFVVMGSPVSSARAVASKETMLPVTF